MQKKTVCEWVQWLGKGFAWPRSKKADGDSASEASVEEVEGEKRGGYLPDDTYAYCVAHLIVLVLSRGRVGLCA